MKILYSKREMPLWGEILCYLIVNLVSLLFFAINTYLFVCLFIFLNFVVWISIKTAKKLEKWKKYTLENDSFFQKNNFIIASYGKYSLLTVSSTILRIVNFNSNVQIKRISKSRRILFDYVYYNISEVYKNYPQKGVDLILNGKSIYYCDIPISEIKLVQAILQKDATSLDAFSTSVFDNSNFGVKITTINDEIIDVDTHFPKEFVDEINKFIISFH
jgi:hypothetical protein